MPIIPPPPPPPPPPHSGDVFVHQKYFLGCIPLGDPFTMAEARARPVLVVSVMRDGSWNTVVVDRLVPGDVFKLTPGLWIPADCVLVSNEAEITPSLTIDTEALTGESFPLQPHTGVDVIYGGSRVRDAPTDGVLAVVTHTGAKTFWGKILVNMLVQDLECCVKIQSHTVPPQHPSLEGLFARAANQDHRV